MTQEEKNKQWNGLLDLLGYNLKDMQEIADRISEHNDKIALGLEGIIKRLRDFCIKNKRKETKK